METAREWGWETFGNLELGDARLTSRVVSLVAAAAQRPGGRVTDVCQDAAEREAAYRLLEKGQAPAEALGGAIAKATSRRCVGLAKVYVPVDQTSVSLMDRQGLKKLGRTRSANSVRQGLQVMNALAIDPNGTPLGLLGQQWWRRPDELSPPWHQDRRLAEQRESILWERTLDQVMGVLPEDVRAWFQLDRGADSNRVLQWAHAHRDRADVTFRSAYERRLLDGKRLRKQLGRSQPQGLLMVPVRASRGRGRQRPARVAQCAVRFGSFALKPERCSEAIPVGVIHLREQRRRKQPLEWWLITTKPLKTLTDVLEVIRAYTLRWRVEELHFTWKTGACDVESSQLRTTRALKSWATVLSAVAARIERLKHLSRTEPDTPASVELNRHEIDAAIILSRTKQHRVGDRLTIAQAVRLIAIVGGHAGYPSAGPPGSKVLGRGFERVLAAAQVAAELRK